MIVQTLCIKCVRRGGGTGGDVRRLNPHIGSLVSGSLVGAFGVSFIIVGGFVLGSCCCHRWKGHS
jgi:hypothetical protein